MSKNAKREEFIENLKKILSYGCDPPEFLVVTENWLKQYRELVGHETSYQGVPLEVVESSEPSND